jgi:hypothetical protein
MIQNMNCIHEDVCVMLGDRGICSPRCHEYIFDVRKEMAMRQYFNNFKMLPIPYDMRVGYIQTDKKLQGMRVIDRRNEMVR